MGKLGFVSEIRIDKKTSDQNIKDYLTSVGKDGILKTSFSIDTESMKTITNQLKEFNNFKLNIGENGIESVVKTMAQGFGQLVTYTDTLNKATNTWEQHISVSSDKLKVQEDIYGRMLKLLREKGKLERESIALSGEALDLNLKSQNRIDTQMNKYESFIDKEDLFNLAEYMKLTDQINKNQQDFDMAWAKHTNAEEKKKEIELEKQLAKEQRERKREEERAYREKAKYLEKYAKDYDRLLENQEKAEEKAFKDNQTAAFTRLVDLTKQRGDLEQKLETYSGNKLRNAMEECKYIKQSIREQEKLIKKSGYESDDLRAKVLEQERQNQIALNRIKANNKDNLQSQQYDKLIKALEKSYQLKIKMVNATDEENEVYEKQLKTVNSIIASTQSRIWNKHNGIRDEKLDTVVAQTKEIGNMQLDIAKSKKEHNDLLREQGKILDSLIKDENKLFELRKQFAYANPQDRENIGTGINDLELKIKEQIAKLSEHEIINASKMEKYDETKIKNAERLKAIYTGIKEEEEKALEIVENAKRSANISLDNLMSGRNANYINTDKLRELQSRISSLNAINTKQARSEIAKLNLEIKELTSDANQRRLKNSLDGVHGLQQSFKSLTGYVSGAMIIHELWNAFKSGISYIKELDDAYTDVAISMDVSREKFNQWTQDARKIAQNNGILTTSVMDMVKIYATAGETIEDIQDKLEGTAKIQNITQWSAEQTTSAVNSIINQYKLLDKEIKGTTGNVANAIEYMGDALIGVSNQLKVDNVSGIQEMVEAIDTAGGIMEQSGASMEWYMAVAGTLNETMNASGSEIGNAFKMISARIFSQAEAMEQLGESSENIEIEMRKAEEALKNVGIAVRDASNPSQLRDMEDIIDELAGKWDRLSDATKQYVAEGVAGTNRRNYFVTMMENYDRVLELTNAGMESQGALAEANEERVNSLAGQMNILTDRMLSFMDSFEPVILGSVKFANGILDIVDSIGTLPTVLGSASTYFLMFNENGQQFTQSLLDLSTTYTHWVSNVDKSKIKLQELIAQKQIDIAMTKQNIVAYQSMGANTSALVTKLAGLKAGLVGTQIQLALTTVKVVALQAAMSLGLSVAITAVATGITKLVGWLVDYVDVSGRAEKATQNLSDASDKLKSTMSSNVTDLIGELEEVTDKINSVAYNSEERNELASQLNSIRQELIGVDEEYAKILENETLTYEQQLALVKELREEKAKDDAEALDKSWTKFEKAKGSIESYNAQILKTKENIDTITEALNNSTNGEASWRGYNYTVEELNEILEQSKEKYKDLYQVIVQYNSDVRAMNEAGHETERTTISLTYAFKELFDEILGIPKAVDKASGSVDVLEKKLSDLHYLLNDTDSSQKQFIDLGNTMEEVYSLIQDINEQGMNFDNMAKVQSLFGDIAVDITNAADVQEFLNQKIADMDEAQSVAYQHMMENNNEYFNTTIKNTSQWEQFTIDVNTNLSKIHASMLNTMGSNYEKYFGDIAESYGIDLTNCKNLAEARIKIEEQANMSIAKMRQAISDASYEHGIGNGEYHETGVTQNYREEIAKIQQWKEQALGYINQIASFTKPTFSSMASNSGTGSSSSSTEKIVDDLEDVVDAYYEIENAIKDVNNALDLNQAKQENANGKDRVALMKEEVELLKQKQKLLLQHQGEMEKERDSLKKLLRENGFKFDSDGDISNYKKRLQELQDWANSLKGDAKTEAIEFVESMIDVIDRYTTLCKEEIPNISEEWESLTTAIKDAEREQLEYVTNVQKDITDAIKNELEKRTDAIKKELQKQQDLYNAQYEEEEYEDNLSKEQRKLDQIQQQINDLSRDTSETGKLRLQQLREEYAAQQEVINQMIRDWEKEQGDDAFQNAMDKADEELETALDPKNIADMVNQALLDGFVTIGNEVVELDTLMSDWLNETGDGLLAIGDLLRSELLDSLVQAGTLMGSIHDSYSNIFPKTGINVNTRSLPNSTQDLSPIINFNSPLLAVEGDITEDVSDTLNGLMEQLKYEVMTTVSKALQTY